MAKKQIKKVKVVIPAGKATPAPPLGPALGQAGINIGDFVNKFNAATSQFAGELLPTNIYVYDDRSYDFVAKSPSAVSLIKKAINLEKGSAKAHTSKVGKISRAQLEEIAKRKMADLNAKDMDGAVAILAGTARSMGIDVK